jgi:DNA-binding transcriptional ArsR family regulator
MAAVPAESTRLLAAIGHPVRLPILMALEERPRAAADLARDLGLRYDKVNHAIHVLDAAGLIYLAEEGMRDGMAFKVYACNHSGWKRLLAPLARIADTYQPDP